MPGVIGVICKLRRDITPVASCVWRDFGYAVWRLLGSQLGRLLGSQLGRLLGSQLRRLLGSQLGRLLGSQLRRLLGSQLERLCIDPKVDQKVYRRPFVYKSLHRVQNINAHISSCIFSPPMLWCT